jgi:hypothetical protein
MTDTKWTRHHIPLVADGFRPVQPSMAASSRVPLDAEPGGHCPRWTQRPYTKCIFPPTVIGSCRAPISQLQLERENHCSPLARG